MQWEPRDLPENNVTPVHPLAELFTLTAGIVTVVVLLILALTVALDVAIRCISPNWEAHVFSSFWKDHVDHTDDPRFAATASLLDQLSSEWTENPYDFHLVILDADDCNAFAFPGGVIAVTQGLLGQVESENELAFILAHEIGHFSLRHHLRGISSSLAIGIVLEIITSNSSGSILIQWTSQLMQLTFSREHEKEADRFGLGLIVRHYGHIAGTTDFLAKLPDEQQKGQFKNVAPYQEWLSTHPSSPKRIAALRHFAIQNAWRVSGKVTPLDDSFRPQ